MKTKDSHRPVPYETQSLALTKHEIDSRDHGFVGPRSFLQRLGMAAAAALVALQC
jgi:hypothetical protein